jgi:mevalonate kinase
MIARGLPPLLWRGRGRSIYNSKILLFGEYALMLGSRALTIPFRKFSGRLEFDSARFPVNQLSKANLKEFLDYLERSKPGFPPGLDLRLNDFKTDLDKGLFLNSDIPQGYGAGSSGVVVAAVYSGYAINPVIPGKISDLITLKKHFSFMESFFHGKSSGLDPLSCYAGNPLLVSSPEKIEMVKFPCSTNNGALDIFLVDTGMTSKTEGLVQLFHEKLKDNQYNDIIENSVIPRNNFCIDLLLNGNITDFFDEVLLLSDLQFEYFPEMIPGEFKEFWRNGIISRHYALKLCGSGGGGFVLGFTPDFSSSEEYFNKIGSKLIHVLKIKKGI